MVWVGYAWISRLIHESESHAFAHLMFALAFGLSAYNFFRAVTLDPGTAPKPSSDDELKAVRLSSPGKLEMPLHLLQS